MLLLLLQRLRMILSRLLKETLLVLMLVDLLSQDSPILHQTDRPAEKKHMRLGWVD